MKRQHFFTNLLLLSAAAITYSSCNDGKIKYDEDKARNHVISVTRAKELEKNFINSRTGLNELARDSSQSKSGKLNDFLNTRFKIDNAETFGRDAIAMLLDQTGTDSIRIYYGADASGMLRLVLVPVDKNGRDILKPLVSKRNAITIPGVTPAYADGDDDNQTVESGQTCPPCLIGQP